jgi:hypothetical protein
MNLKTDVKVLPSEEVGSGVNWSAEAMFHLTGHLLIRREHATKRGTSSKALESLRRDSAHEQSRRNTNGPKRRHFLNSESCRRES